MVALKEASMEVIKTGMLRALATLAIKANPHGPLASFCGTVMTVMWFVGMFSDPSMWKFTVKSILTVLGLLEIKTKFSMQISTKLLSSLRKSSARKTTMTTPQNKANGLCRLAFMAGIAKVHSIPF